MTDKQVSLNKNELVRYLQKPMCSFTREDIVRYIVDNDIEMVNFMYPAADGRLKTLNFVINDLDYLETILTLGERVDGSSLFPFISASSSDLYVLPRFSSAFRDPFATIPTVTMLCSFFDKDGNPLECSPRHTLVKACDEFNKETGLHFECMGELEYYVIQAGDTSFPATDQRNYHESAPFAKFNDLRTRCMHYIAQTGGQIKYGHSEVGNFTIGDIVYEQNEIEFLPVSAPEAADQLMLAKWIIRNLAWEEGYDVTFAPKITVGKAGSGLHIHMRMVDDSGKNMMLGDDRRLSETARRAIAGLMKLAPAITAFGNTNPTSYFRLVPHQEAPTNVCWGDRNRSVLVRVPLGWTTDKDMCAELNPGTASLHLDTTQKQTVEIRSADGSADVYLLMASLAVALRYGYELEDGLKVAANTYVDVNIHNSENAAILDRLAQLPVNCAESAACLEAVRGIFEAKNVFDPAMINDIIRKLKSYDTNEAEQAKNDPELMLKFVERYFHC
ncbi:MAG: glutamine synthetase family protein [Bacteroidales bacterium]|nr:glutamine synthetase family protein [Bacteroidales bacterium]